MRILGIDTETTGLDPRKDRIIEIGTVIWCTDERRPLTASGVFLYEESYPPISPDAARVNGITPDMLREFGQPPERVFRELNKMCKEHKISYAVAHNGLAFDKLFFMEELRRLSLHSFYFRNLPWLDTKLHLPHVSTPDSLKLKHLALDAGFINPFPHRAMFDVLTMMKVLDQFKIEDVIAESLIPSITIRALVSFDDRQKAKDRRYSWEKLGEKVYPKCWVKSIKKTKLEQEKSESPFQIVVLNEV